MTKSQSTKGESRPAFMVQLGLLPPYAHDDVKQAYLAKSRLAHPDRGGSVADFHALREAYDAAKEYIDYQGDRRSWIAAMVEKSIAQDVVVAKIESLGAEVRTTTLGWLEQSLGDFASLTETVESITLHNSEAGDRLIEQLLNHQQTLDNLQHLDLAGSQLSDSSVERLHVFSRISSLNLSKTAVTNQMLSIVGRLPTLTRLELSGTKVSWLKRQQVKSTLRRRAASKPTAMFPAN
ncbi:MAG: hypothetical protein GY768_32035 [Planctomycetaceae bacterium]|nr:hypothetical protein [Planctomycetaceae bacterium]